ncbi:hypothetical protein ACROYT_G017287 [Oculina patagonica]
MMRIRLCTFKCLVVCFGIAGLVLIARRNVLWKKTFSTKDWSTFYQEHITQQLSDPQNHARPCNPERSIESLTGAILDAHPEILIPQEYDVIGNWKMYQDKKLQDFGQQTYMLFFDMHYLSTFQAVFQNKANKPSQFWLWTSKGDGIYYNYVPDVRQGKINGKPKVIGDTSGGETSKKLSQSRGSFEVLEEIQNVVRIPVKFVHIITNPFDVIASSLIKQSDSYNKIDDLYFLGENKNTIHYVFFTFVHCLACGVYY